MYMDILAALLVLFLTFVLINNKKEPKKLFGVYTQPGKWYFLKYPVFTALLSLRRLKYYCLGKAMFNVKEMDRRQPLSEDPLAFDAIFFHAVSQKGVFLVAGAERRQAGFINGLMYIQHPDFGLLKTPKLPRTKLQEDPESIMSGKEWAAEGLMYVPVEPMQRWNLSYRGKMRVHGDDERLVDVRVQAKWTSDLEWFFYDVDLPVKVLARTIAREPWTKELFDCLREAHQTHYEQMGFLEGTLTVDGKEVPLKLDAFRDHSFGKKRDWSLMHRYIFQMFYMENQTRIVLGVVSQPCTGSHYEMGYVVQPNGKIDPIDSCDLRLWQHGESGLPSEELNFTFTAAEHVYECKVRYDLTVAHFVGEDSAVKMYERFCSCEVNGVKGKAIAEWNYNNTNGKFDLDQYHC